MIHLKQIDIYRDNFPDTDLYPYHLEILKQTPSINFSTSVTFFIGENGSGKSTMLQAISNRCGIHIWEETNKPRVSQNPYEQELYKSLLATWEDGPVKGSFFSSRIFSQFAQNLEEWAVNDEAQLDFFGGKSLVTQSHGQSLMSYFKSRYTIPGLYFLDEPETALSPASLVELLNLLNQYNQNGKAQFIIATHSPILLACPGAQIYSFNSSHIEPVAYQETDYYTIYKEFMADPDRFIK